MAVAALVVCAAVPATAGAVITLRQPAFGTSTKSALVQLSVSPPTAIAANSSIIVVAAMHWVAGLVACSDDAGNTYAIDSDHSNGTNLRLVVCSAHLVAPVSTSQSINISYPANTATVMLVAEYTSLAGPFDRKQTATGADSGLMNSGTTATTSRASELLFGAFGVRDSSGGFNFFAPFTPVAGLSTSGGSASTNELAVIGNQIVSAVGAYAASATIQGSSAPWAGAIVTYPDRTPDPPGQPSASPNPTSGPVNLTWAEPVWKPAGIQNYDVEVSTDSGSNWSAVGTTSDSTASFSYSPAPGSYLYRVRARDTTGLLSPYSVNSATVVVNDPYAPWFATGTYSGNSSSGRQITGVGFAPEFVLVKGPGTETVIRTTGMGLSRVACCAGSGMAGGHITALDADGFTIGNASTVNTTGTSYVWIAIRSIAGNVKVGNYTGNGVDNRDITGLGFQPAYVMLLPVSSAPVPWRNTTMPASFSSWADDGLLSADAIQGFVSDGFQVGLNASVNQNTTVYHYLAIRGDANRMAQGSYSGNNTDNRDIPVGFQPSWVTVKADSSSTGIQHRTSSMTVPDTSLTWNNSGTQNNRVQLLTASGFQVGTSNTVNATGTTYYWVAFRNPTADATPPLAGTVNDGANAGMDIDFQASTTTIEANWSGFSDPEGAITDYEWAIGTSVGGNDIQDWVSVGTTTSASNNALALLNNQPYYVSVRATSAGGSVTTSSDGVIIDTSVPTAGAVSDGLAADRDWQSSNTTIQANWSGFADPQSGITGYEWAIGTTSGGTQVQAFTSVGLVTNATNSSLSLSNGQIYYVTVRATSGAGVTVNATSDGVTVDTSGPVAGSVSDGPAADIDVQGSTTTIQANWTAFTDSQSGIATLEWAIGTTSGGTQVQAFTTTGISGNTATRAGLSLTGGSTYFVTVRATSGAGATVNDSSDGVVVDTSVPTAGTVNDGTGADLDSQPSKSTLSANWSGFADAQSGITGYEWAIGTTAGGIQVQAFTPVALATNATNGSLSLDIGTTYYVTVRATNGVGGIVTASSDGVTINQTRVRTGFYTGNGTTQSITGLGFSPDFVIVKVNLGGERALGCSRSMPPGQCKELYDDGLMVTGGVTSIDADGFTVGGLSNANSNGLRHDYIAFKVAPGDSFYGSYGGNGSDNRSITGLGFQPDFVMIMPAQSGSGTSAPSWRNSAMAGDLSYEASSVSGPKANLIQSLLANGFQIGNASIVNGSGTFHYLAFRASERLMFGSYGGDGLDDRTIGGITFRPTWLMLQGSNNIPVHRPSSLGTADATPHFSGVSHLPNCIQSLTSTGFTVGTHVRCNSAGQTYHWNAWRDHDVPDATAPIAGTVLDGAGSDVDYQLSTSTIQANWSGFDDPDSWVAGYEWAIGTTVGGTNLQGFTSVGLATSASNGSLSLSNGQIYYVTVRATNGSGVPVTVTSDGVTVDNTDPLGGTVADGAGADIDFQASTSTLSANWSGFSDPESGIVGYQWAVGTSLGSQDVQSFTNVAGTSASGAFSLLSGQPYYVTVRAINGNGLSVQVSSDGVIVDPSPPLAGAVSDGPAADIQFQSSTTTINANWTAFSDPQSGIVTLEWAIGTTLGGTQVQAFTGTGISGNTASNSSLSLVNGQIYFVTVRATNGTGAQITASSNGVTVDTSGPTAGAVNDGPSGDIDVQTSATTLSANWSGFADPQSGITGYEWAIGTTLGGTQVQAFTSVGAMGSASNASLALSDGQTYYVTVRATSGMGLTINATSDGVLVDASAPIAGTVADGGGADIQFQSSTAGISANWTSFSDPHSGITSLEWAIGTTSGGQQVQAFTSTGISGNTASRGGLSLTSGQIYFVTVRATNGTGLSVTASSNGVTVDSSGPIAGTVSDGVGADIDWQASTSTINANWTAFSDPQSGVVTLEWAIGTTSGGQQIQAFTNSGISGNTGSAGALSLANGQIYFVTVRATNGTGAQVTATSDGVTVDTSGPTPGSVSDGPAADIDVQSSTASISANWSGFADPQSGIAGYEWAIGTTSGGAQIQGFISVGAATNATNSSVSLTNGQIYFVTVRATNGTGAQVTATSDGVTVDNSGPVAGTVSDGNGADVDWQSSLTNISANWSGFADAQSGITGYEWAIGTTSGGQQIQTFTNVGITGNVAIRSGLTLANGQIYFVTVRATSGTGAQVMASSDGVTVDTSGPGPGSVADGLAADIDWQASTSAISANWVGFTDPQSGITGYEWAIGTTSGGTQIQGFTSVGAATNATNGSVSLANGQIYFVMVRATSGTGAQVTATSDGVTVDSSGPTAGSVNDGVSADVDFQLSASTIQANWSGFADPQSGIAGYEWAIGTLSGGTQIQGFTSVGMATSASNSSLALGNGQIYFVTVRAISGTGAQISASSDGVTVDNSGPTAGTVADGLAADVDFQSSLSAISANWSGFADAQSGIAGYEWAIGTTSGGAEVQAFTGVAMATSATNSSLSLANGTQYFVTVRATNATGAQVTATSDGVTVDASGPVAGTVNDGPAADIQFQSSTTDISANWTAFSDPQSAITSLEWAIGTTSGGIEVQGFTTSGISGNSATASGLSLTTGTTYYVTVRGTNGAGLSITASSNGVTVDGSAPVAGVVRDGTTVGVDLDQQVSNSSLGANWSAFTDSQSGVVGYEWAVGTSPGATNVIGFTSVGSATSASAPVGLTNGSTYYVTVRATNGVGLTSTATSDGILVTGDGHHVAISAVASALAGDLVTVTFQVVDSGGAPVFLDIPLEIKATGSAAFVASTLNGASALPDTEVTGSTGGDGLATVDLVDTVAEQVIITVLSPLLPGSNAPHLLTINPAAANHVRAVATGPTTLGACSATTLELAVVDAYDNVRPEVSTVTLCPEPLKSATIDSTTLANEAPGAGGCVSGDLDATGKATATVSDTVAETVIFTPSQSGLPGVAVSASITWQAGSADPANSLFVIDEGDGAMLSTYSGSVTARVTVRDACGLPVAVSPGDVAISGQAPLQIGAVTADLVNAGEWIATVTLPSCPANAPAPLTLDATIAGNAVGGGLPVQRTVVPVCTPPDPGLSSVSPPGPLTVAACWSLAGTPAAPTGIGALTAVLTVQAVDVNGQSMGAGHQIAAVQDPPRLLAAPAVDNGDGSYTLEVGSNACGTITVPVTINGVLLNTQPQVTFTCPAVAGAQTLQALPAAVEAGQSAVITALATDICANPAALRPISASTSLGTIGPLPSNTDADGRLVLTVSSADVGRAQVQGAVDGVPLAPVEVTFHLPAGVLAMSVDPTGERQATGAPIALVVRLTSSWQGSVPGLALGLGASGLVIDTATAGGSSLPVVNGLHQLPDLAPGEVLDVAVLGRVSAHPGQEAMLQARALDGDGRLLAQADGSRMRVGDIPINVGRLGAGCAHGAAQGLAAIASALLLVGLARRRRPRRR
jgi:hypothetical protein